MVAGDKVLLKVDGNSLLVENRRGEYMGRVEPKTAQRLARLILGGNQYTATIVKSQVDLMSVIIRETCQDPSQAGKLSFPPKGADDSRAYAGERLLKEDANYEEDNEDESGYTIIGGDEVEVLSDGNEDIDDDTGNEDD